jgi:hypothetical protein
MQDWKCSVRMPSNHIQTVWVEAYNYSDAVSMAESSTGGKCLNAAAQFSSSSSASNSNEGAEINGGLILFGLAVMMLVYAWKWILLIGAISLVIWLVIKYSQE